MATQPSEPTLLTTARRKCRRQYCASGFFLRGERRPGSLTAMPRIRRTLGIVFGIATQALFLVTVWQLFWFLKDGGPRDIHGEFWVDALLAIQFAAPHSLLLLPSVRKFLGKWITREFYPLCYCCVTCANLLITINFWRFSNDVVWELNGLPSTLVQVAFYLSWVALMYSLNLSGFGSQTGLPQWWHWVRRRSLAKPEFKPRGAYLWLRHPVYLCFAGLIWFTPMMTLDHVILTGVWTVYLLLGSCLKDRRMSCYLGDLYREYQQRVPGFPGMPCGPLARHQALPVTSDVAARPSKRSTLRKAA
jgi:protein-S-isoprenylcysteine O-methyltransferase Ste14